MQVNNKLINCTKNRVTSLIPFTEKTLGEKIGICSISGRIRSRSGPVFPEADPHKNEADPKHC